MVFLPGLSGFSFRSVSGWKFFLVRVGWGYVFHCFLAWWSGFVLRSWALALDCVYYRFVWGLLSIRFDIFLSECGCCKAKDVSFRTCGVGLVCLGVFWSLFWLSHGVLGAL